MVTTWLASVATFSVSGAAPLATIIINGGDCAFTEENVGKRAIFVGLRRTLSTMTMSGCWEWGPETRSVSAQNTARPGSSTVATRIFVSSDLGPGRLSH